jgi:NAD(P)H-hydrate epimerase
VLAGCSSYSGAAVLCAEAALRAGAGLVTIGIPESIVNPLIKIKPKEAMILGLAQTKDCTVSAVAYNRIFDFLEKTDVLVIGPGLSQNQSTLKLIRKVIQTSEKPMVIDADGLNALAGHLNILSGRQHKAAGAVITPHPGEMARLLGIAASSVQKMRKKVAKEFASRYNNTVVLKGRQTIVADSNNKMYVNQTGNPGMATAGSGDVLAGIIGAFLGQGLDCFSAAKYSVYLHGLAGDLAAKEKGQLSLIASDIIAALPMAIKKSS